MLEFLRKKKYIQIGKLRVEIYRRGVGFFYTLIFLFLKLKKSNPEKIDVYLKELINVSKMFFKVQNWMYRLGVRKLKISEFLTILSEIINFNFPQTKEKNERGITEREFTESVYYIISQVIFYTGWSLEYILEQMDFVSLYIVFMNIRFKRFNDAVDTAGAWDLNKFKKVMMI